MITTTANEIRLEVSNELNDLSSSIDVKLDGITLETIGADGTVSSVKLFDTGKIDLTGYATFNGLSGGTTTIDGACIKTGTISAERINLTGSITWSDLSTSVQNEFGDGLTEEEVSTLITSELVSSPTIAGGKFTDLKQKNYLKMGSSSDNGVGYLNHYFTAYSTSEPVCVMGYQQGQLPNWILAPYNIPVLAFARKSSTSGLTAAMGEWDFSGATVTGLGIDTGNITVVPVWG